MYELPQQSNEEAPIFRAIREGSFKPFYNNRNFGKAISQSISDPRSYMAVGKIAPTKSLLTMKNKLPKKLVSKLKDTFKANSFQKDIDTFQAQQALARQAYRKQAQQMEQRKQYFLGSTPEQRFIDRVNQFRQQ